MLTLVKTQELTPGERLETLRRREGMTQYEAAAEWGIPVSRLRSMEHGEEKVPQNLLKPLGPLTLAEQLHVLRRRQGWTLAELSKRCKLSLPWLSQAERGHVNPPQKLVGFWRARRS